MTVYLGGRAPWHWGEARSIWKTPEATAELARSTLDVVLGLYDRSRDRVAQERAGLLGIFAAGLAVMLGLVGVVAAIANGPPGRAAPGLWWVPAGPIIASIVIALPVPRRRRGRTVDPSKASKYALAASGEAEAIGRIVDEVVSAIDADDDRADELARRTVVALVLLAVGAGLCLIPVGLHFSAVFTVP